MNALNNNVFTSLAETRRPVENWRCDYNEHRPQRLLGRPFIWLMASTLILGYNRTPAVLLKNGFE